MPFTATGATGAVQYPAELYVSSMQMPTKDAPLAPQITPVLNMQLNGTAFAQYGTVPTLSPKLTSAQTQSYYQHVIDLFIKDHMFTIPAGILTAGNEYFFVVRVCLAPSVDFTTAPYRGAFPWALADMVTPAISTTGARHTDDGGARYSSVCQPFRRDVGTRRTWTDPFNSGSFQSWTALQRSVKSQQAEKNCPKSK